MSTMMIATVLAAFYTIILAQERSIEIVGWFPDRDNITTSHECIANHMFAVNVSAFCQRFSIDERPIKTLIGIPEPDPKKSKQSWYDELVCIPDFLAGPFAGWNYKKSLVPGRQKYVEILQSAVADNQYLITLLLNDMEQGGIRKFTNRPVLAEDDTVDLHLCHWPEFNDRRIQERKLSFT